MLPNHKYQIRVPTPLRTNQLRKLFDIITRNIFHCSKYLGKYVKIQTFFKLNSDLILEVIIINHEI